MIKEKERKELVRNCLKEYYQEDKQILIDESIMQVTCSTFLLYNHIFFGNSILLTNETYDRLVSISKKEANCLKEEILTKNAGYILENMERDENGNYRIISIKKYGNTKLSALASFLEKHPKIIFYLSNDKLYQELQEKGINKNQLYFLNMGMKETNPFQTREIKFETIGAIQFKNEKMIIEPKGDALIKVFNSRGEEKKDRVKEVKPRDLVLIRGKKEHAYSFNLYEVVSKHTRNQAVRIIWTDLKFGQKTNKYIDRLPYQYRKMILDAAKE